MDAMQRVLSAMAYGDALGLPWEGMGPGSIRADEEGWPTLLGRGFVSDDTEHACLTAHALAEAQGDMEGFRSRLAGKLRRWFLALPPGIGLGTARSLIKLCVGWNPARSGSSSAGNGPCMRAAPIGVHCSADELDAWVDASSLITHADPRALEGARLVAWVAHLAAKGLGKQAIVAEVLPRLKGEELVGAMGLAAKLETHELVRELRLEGGITGYTNHTVPVAFSLWLRCESVEEAAKLAVRLGGDTDTVAAIAAGMLGAHPGAEVPQVTVPTASELGWARQLGTNMLVLPVSIVHVVVRRMVRGLAWA